MTNRSPKAARNYMQYIWQIDGEKDCVLTWGGLMDMGSFFYEPWLKQDLS